MNTIIKRKLTTLVVILLALLVIPAGYALAAALFSAAQVTTDLTVAEPLSISSTSVQAGNQIGSCTVSTAPPSASCTIGAFAGDSVILTIEVANAAQTDITVTVSPESTNPAVAATGVQFCESLAPTTCTNAASTGIVPATGAVLIVVTFAVSQSAALGSATLTVEILR